MLITYYTEILSSACSHWCLFQGCFVDTEQKLKEKKSSNRPFPSSLVPLFQNESKYETFHMKMSLTCSFIFMQIKVIFIRMVSHLDSL